MNSLLMKMPESPEVHNMISMVTLTPYYREDTALDLQVRDSQQKIYTQRKEGYRHPKLGGGSPRSL